MDARTNPVAGTITEAELADNARNGAVERISLVPCRNKRGFNLWVSLNWKKGEFVLITQHKKPRTWVSADRLLSHVNTQYGNVKSLEIFLKEQIHEHSSTSN